MTTARAERPRTASRGQPTWEIVQYFPKQGEWCEEDFLALDDNHRAELSNGYLEILPMPTHSHQAILAFLFTALQSYVDAHALGKALFSGLPVRLWEGTLREPDIVFLRKERFSLIGEQYWSGCDLVMEIVSKNNRDHDIKTKRREYARAGIPEYWIVDPQKSQITVLKLKGRRYVDHGVFGKGERATSVLLPGFNVDVTAALTAK